MAVKKTKTGASKNKSGGKTRAAAKPRAKAKPVTAANKSKKPGAKLNSNVSALDDLIEDLNMVMENFMNTVKLYSNLTPKERERLISAGIRNYGLIEKTRDIARDNPDFLPPNFDETVFSNNLYEFDQVRQFYLVAEKLQSIASDKMMLLSDNLYRESLRVYNTLREQSRAGVAGARDLFLALAPFFRRKRPGEKPPTEEQEVKKARSLIKGKAEGEMIIKNIKPKTSGGVHEVVEDIHKNRIEGKETAEFSDIK